MVALEELVEWGSITGPTKNDRPELLKEVHWVQTREDEEDKGVDHEQHDQKTKVGGQNEVDHREDAADAQIREGARDQAEDADGGNLQDHGDHGHHDGVELGEEAVDGGNLATQRAQQEAQDQCEEDDLEHGAVGQCCKDVGGDDVQQRGFEVLVLGCLRLNLGDGVHIQANAGVGDVGKHQCDDDGQSGGQQVHDDGAAANLAEHLRVAHGCGAADNGAENQRSDEHLHQADEALSEDIEDALDEEVVNGGLVGDDLVQEQAADDAGCKRDQDPRSES